MSDRSKNESAIIRLSIAFVMISFFNPLSPLEAFEDDEREKAEVHLWKEGGDRVIRAGIDIQASSQVLWAVLTDYDNLETFVPDLIQSRILERGEDGLIRLEQISVRRFIFFKKRVRVLLQVSEELHHKIEFVLIEGDFQTYQGSWAIDAEKEPIRLNLNLRTRPAFFAPGFILDRVLRTSSAQNLEAVREEALRRKKEIGK